MAKIIDLASQSADVELAGMVPGDYSGMSLTSGDFNGDGQEDLAILSPGAAPLGGTRRGIVNLLWGPFDQGTTAQVNNLPGIWIFGTSVDADLTSGLSAGDLNADGLDDLIWGQPLGLNIWRDGVVYVVMGRHVFPDTIDLAIGAEGVVTALGPPWSADFGRSTCGCDVDGDAYDDLAIGGAYGEMVVIHGSDSLRATYELGQDYADMSRVLDLPYLAETNNDLACADMDGDARDDLVVGHGADFDHPGVVRVLYGHSSWRDTLFFDDPIFRTVTMIAPPQSGGLANVKVAIAVPELEVLATNDNADPLGCFNCGEVYRTFAVSELPDSQAINSDMVARSVLIGSGISTLHGSNVETGDFNADGWTDVAVVSQGAVDKTIVVFGRASLPDSVFLGSDTSLTRILGRDAGGDLGKGIAVADFNDDGVDDLALGAWLAPSQGRTYVLFGDPESTGVEVEPIPASVSLSQNYPNPFNPVTTIVFTLPSAGYVRLDVFDVGGRFVERLVDEWRVRDQHEIHWDGRDWDGRPLASGVYFYRLTTPQGSVTRKAVLLR
ncbi:MAG: T9SS type A sorting domain-containing protein [Candidatus Krumholzibacteria bacterium]|nr:T9SS type A sorting domain-containing protein [Candidatus Krumholzibacteria bacterium]